MARLRKPIDWLKCPVRKCRSAQTCLICGEVINVGDMYYDAMNNKRAHVSCVVEPSVNDFVVQEPVEEKSPVQEDTTVQESEIKEDVSTENVVVPYSSHEAEHVLLFEHFKKLQDQVLSLSNAVTELQLRLEDLDERKANKDEIESFDPRELDFFDD